MHTRTQRNTHSLCFNALLPHSVPSPLPTTTPTFCLFAYYHGLTYYAWMNFSKCGVQSHTSIHTITDWLIGWLAGWLADMVTSPLAQTHEAFWTTPRHTRPYTHTPKPCAHTNTHLHIGTRLPWCNRGKGAESKPKPRLIPPDPSKIE